MLGIQDPSVWIALIVCVGSALLCVVYGIVNWNKGNGEKNGGDKR